MRNVERDAGIRAMREDGARQSDIAHAFGLSEERIRQILGNCRVPRVLPPGRVDSSKTAEMLSLYQAGLTLRAIGVRFGISGTSVHAKLQNLEGYVARKSSRPQPGTDVPAWVPERMRDRYLNLTHRHDEHIAASCIRAAKRMEAHA